MSLPSGASPWMAFCSDRRSKYNKRYLSKSEHNSLTGIWTRLLWFHSPALWPLHHEDTPILHRYPEQNPHHQMQFSIIPMTPPFGVLLSTGYTVCAFQVLLTGQIVRKEKVWKIWFLCNTSYRDQACLHICICAPPLKWSCVKHYSLEDCEK